MGTVVQLQRSLEKEQGKEYLLERKYERKVIRVSHSSLVLLSCLKPKISSWSCHPCLHYCNPIYPPIIYIHINIHDLSSYLKKYELIPKR